MIFIYRVLTNLFYPFLIIFFYYRKLQNKEHKIRFKEKIFSSCFNVVRKKNFKLVWFHAASIGEMKSIIPIIEAINKKKSNFEFLITTITLSSSNLAETEFKYFDNVQHRFFPLDVDFLIKSFLNKWRPDFIFFVDSEIWPNLVINAKKNKIPLAIINARITKKSSKRWLRFPNTAAKIFKNIDLCLSSNKETQEFLLKFNKNVFLTGNIKLISKNLSEVKENLNEKILIRKKIWLAASTHKSEEIFCLKAHLKIKKEFDNLITIIAPRHIVRANEIQKICNSFNLKSQILNKDDLIREESEIIIINSFGNLDQFFKIAKSVFIGKSINPKLKDQGGQSPIDAATLGCKIYHGPYVYNFKEIYEILKKNKITEEIKNFDELAFKIKSDLSIENKNNGKFREIMISLKQDTLNKTMREINNFLSNETL